MLYSKLLYDIYGSGEAKPKIFLAFLLFFGGGCGGSRQKMERKFLVFAPATAGSGRGAQIGAYDSGSSHHALRACEVSPLPDFVGKKFGFHRTEGAKELDTNSKFREEMVSLPSPAFGGAGRANPLVFKIRVRI